MNSIIRTKEDLIYHLREKDRIMKKAGFNYVLRANLHSQAMYQLIDQHPELADFIAEAYEESGLVNKKKVLRLLQA